MNVLGSLLPRPNPRTHTALPDHREGMTTIQAIIFDAVREIVKPGLPAQAAAFWPMVEMELAKGLRSCKDSDIQEKFLDVLHSADMVYVKVEEAQKGEPWKPQS